MLDDSTISNHNCGGFIRLDGRLGLSPIHLDNGLTKLYHGFGGDEKSRNFGSSIRGHKKLDYLGDSENMAISVRERGVF